MFATSVWRCALVRLSLFVSLCFPVTSLAAPSLGLASVSRVSTATSPQPTVCGDIVNSGNDTFNAKEAYDCLISVPFNPAVATRFLKYLNDTIQFQSNLAYLKNPPTSYQQPKTDLLQGLDQIQQDIDNDIFPNQYIFEATLQNLIYSAHDDHLYLNAGILAVFTFASPYGIVSVSIDGLQVPKVYIKDDLLETQSGGTSRQPSAIATINGQDVTDYLSQFAALNAVGGLEPNADWNQLMSSPALDIQDDSSIFEGYVTFYPGEDITFVFENGTQLGPEPWLAFYNSQGDTGPLATGGDFYNFFVLGLYPASYNTNDSDSGSNASAAATSGSPAAATSTAPASQSSTASATSWDNPAYPSNPDVVQPDLGNSGVVSGYFLKDISTAVLSIPSFDASGDAVQDFSDTVGNFLNQSKQAGMQKVLVDVQHNSGGVTFLAIDAFKQFFPSIDPFGGSRLRAQNLADVLGTTFTNYYNTPLNDSEYYDLSINEWVATDLLDADTGENFTSWGEFFGPHLYNNDQFTTVQRYNLSSFIYDVIASGGIVVYGYDDRPATSPQPYAAEDIVVLTDSLCSSACALFMEMMHHEAGVRTVVAGGRPEYGAMQAPSGSRGAQLYTTDDLDGDIATAIEINSTASNFLPDRSEDVAIIYASFNLRDQIRSSESTPLQFLYEAADCRIFYTSSTFYNFTNLWTYAANAIWTNPKLCVQGSSGYASNTTTADTTGPPGGSTSVNANVSHNITGIIQMSGVVPSFYAAFSGQELDGATSIPSTKGKSCRGNSDCNKGTICKSVNICGKASRQCVTSCSSHNTACRNCDLRQGFCPPTSHCAGGTIALNNPGLPGQINR